MSRWLEVLYPKKTGIMKISMEENETSFKKTTLDNGLRIVTSEMPRTRSVSINVFIGVGSRYESEERAGLSHFVEHLVFKGTKRRPSPKEISGAVEGMGGALNASTDQELTVYWCKVPHPHFGDSMDLLMDMLRSPLLLQTDIDKERMVVLEELRMNHDYPGYKVDSLIDAMLWPDHPLGRDIAGTEESVNGITKDMVAEHMSRYYGPANMVVSVAGNVTHDEVVEHVASFSNGWSSNDPVEWTPVTHLQSAPQLGLEYRKTEQVHLSVALPGVSITHPDRFALDLLSIILGEGMSSRLFLEVRERLGLAYDIHSGVSHFQDCGAFVIAAGVDPKRVYDAVWTILAELGQVRDRVPDDELEKAKRLGAGRLMLQMEDTRAVSVWMGAQELLRGRILEVDEVVDLIDGIDAEDVQRVANDLLETSKLNVAVVGPCRGRRRLERMLSL